MPTNTNLKTNSRILRAHKRAALLMALFASKLCLTSCAQAPRATVSPTSDVLGCHALPEAKHNPLAPYLAELVVSELSVDALPGPVDTWDPNTKRVAGVAIQVPARPGLTRAALERHVLCYRRTLPATTDDPLLISGTSVRVSDTVGHFELQVTSLDLEVAERVVGAARASLTQPAVHAPLAAK